MEEWEKYLDEKYHKKQLLKLLKSVNKTIAVIEERMQSDIEALKKEISEATGLQKEDAMDILEELRSGYKDLLKDRKSIESDLTKIEKRIVAKKKKSIKTKS